MNDLGLSVRNDSVTRDRKDAPAVDRDTRNPKSPRPALRRRLGGRLFALGALLLLIVGVALGAWGYYSRQRQVMATAEQQRDFVPSLRVAAVVASPGVNPVTLPS